MILLAAIAGLIWLAFISRYPRPAVWVLLLWIPVQGWVQLNLLSDSNLTVLIYEFMILGIYAAFGVRALQRPAAFGPPPVIRYAIAFVVWALLLVPYSVGQTGPVLTLVGLRTYLLPLPLIWIGYRAFETRRQLETVSALIMAQTLLVGAVTVAQFANLSAVTGALTGALQISELPVGYTAVGVVRPPGTFSAPGQLGNYLIFSIPLAIGLLRFHSPFWMRVCYVAGLSGATIALVTNTQRAAIVLVAVTLPVMVTLARRGQAALRMVGAMVIMGAAALYVSDIAGEAFGLRVASIQDDLQAALVINPSERMADALLTPMAGAGLGVASPGAGRLETRAGPGAANVRGESIKFGESFIPALVYETGVPGLLLFYLFLGAIMVQTMRVVKAVRGTDMELLAAGVWSVQFAILLYSWPYGPLLTPPARVLFWFWAGVMLSLPRLAARPALHTPVAAGRTPADRMTGIMGRRVVPPRVAAVRRRIV